MNSSIRILNRNLELVAVLNCTATYNDRVYDLSEGDVKGDFSNLNIDKGYIGLIYYNEELRHAGFIENVKENSLKLKDLRKIFDSELLIDFSNKTEDIFIWNNLINYVNSLVLKDNTDYTIEFSVPDFIEDTKVITNYEGQYIIVNAYSFLKVYLLYYGFYIKTFVDLYNKVIRFAYVKNENEISINLLDFTHSKTINDVKVNRTVATISYSTIKDTDPYFDEITESEYLNISVSKKSEYTGLELPNAVDYPVDYAIAFFNEKSWLQTSGTVTGVANAYINNKLYWVEASGSNFDYTLMIEYDSILSYISNVDYSQFWSDADYRRGIVKSVLSYFVSDINQNNQLQKNTRIKVNTLDSDNSRNDYFVLEEDARYQPPYDFELILNNIISYLESPAGYNYNEIYKVEVWTGLNNDDKGTKVNLGSTIRVKVEGVFVGYFKVKGKEIIPRPTTLPTYIYHLGSDNNIYENNIPAEMKIVPIVSKYFESADLSSAQIEAIYHLLTNRWVENIIIENDSVDLIDFENIELYTSINVYDKNGTLKKIPLVEKNFEYFEDTKRLKVKLGFKKTSFTEIIKNEIAPPENIIKNTGQAKINIDPETLGERSYMGTGEPSSGYLTWLDVEEEDSNKARKTQNITTAFQLENLETVGIAAAEAIEEELKVEGKESSIDVEEMKIIGATSQEVEDLE